MASIYDEIGGDEALSVAVEKFYDLVLKDPLLQLHFDDVDMARKRASFKAYIADMLGAPEKYQGRPLHVAHKGTQITDLGFNLFVGFFIDTLREMKLRDDLVVQVEQKLAALKNDVVDSFTWPGTHFYSRE